MPHPSITPGAHDADSLAPALAPVCDVLILGAGPAGLLCGLTAARRGRSVLLVDHGDLTARKLRASGGGRSNCTNMQAASSHYLSANPHFVKSALARFSPWDFLDLLGEWGLSATEEDQGRMFCDQGATALAEALEGVCRGAGCRFALRHEVRSASVSEGLFQVQTDRGPLAAPRLVLALGSPAWPALGATDMVARLGGSFGLRCIPARPALTPFVLSPADAKLSRELVGLSLTACVACGDTAYTDGLLFTHKGLSGPAALQISSHWRKGQPLRIDLLPGRDLEAELKEDHGRKALVRSWLSGLLPRRLAETLLAVRLPELAELRLCDLTRGQRLTLAGAIQVLTLTPSGTEGMARAEAATGGLDTAGFSSKNMQARAVPGLFAVGEALDVAGELGGYNLHWAWASGHAAGLEA